MAFLVDTVVFVAYRVCDLASAVSVGKEKMFLEGATSSRIIVENS